MTPKERAAMQQALGALVRAEDMYGQPNADIQTALREALAEQAEQEPSCNQHPDAPHGFARNASHNAGRYVCECEGWEPEQEPVAVVEITYGREPECYVTGNIDDFSEGLFKLYAAPVRTKDLTDDEITLVAHETMEGDLLDLPTFARAIVTADREKNK